MDRFPCLPAAGEGRVRVVPKCATLAQNLNGNPQLSNLNCLASHWLRAIAEKIGFLNGSSPCSRFSKLTGARLTSPPSSRLSRQVWQEKESLPKTGLH